MCSGENFSMHFLFLQLYLAVESFPGPFSSWGFSVRKWQLLCSGSWVIRGGLSLCLSLRPQQGSVCWVGSSLANGKWILRGSLWLSL